MGTSLAVTDDFLADYEFARSRGGSSLATAELRLMFAVFEDAVLICLRVRTSVQNYRSSVEEAIDWIESDDGGVMSFRNICEVLGFEPEVWRLGLRRYRERQEMGLSVDRIQKMDTSRLSTRRITTNSWHRKY